MEMRSGYIKLVIAVVALCMALPHARATPWSGTLTWSAAQLVAADHDSNWWASDTTTLTWMVDRRVYNDTELWYYEYQFTVPKGDPSHIIIETSLSFGEGDIFGASHSWELGTWDNRGNSNPSIPGEMYGLKFGTTTLAPTVSFYSPRDPVWGDFYAKDGVDTTFAWNAGFEGAGDVDPTTTVGVDSEPNHLAVPDTSEGAHGEDDSPEPAVWLLLTASGVIGGVIRRRRE